MLALHELSLAKVTVVVGGLGQPYLAEPGIAEEVQNRVGSAWGELEHHAFCENCRKLH